MEPAVVMAAEPSSATSAPWSQARLIGFRFLFCLLVLLNAPFPFGVLPWTEKAYSLWAWPFQASAEWLAEHVLGLGQIVVEFSGSGDRTLDYIMLAMIIALAALAAAAWSLAQRRAPGHERLLAWLRLYVMTALASTMMVYGFAKVFESQFPVPTGAQLALTYGESTPMTLLWTFMGASRPYAIAAGLLEVVGGLLLLWRRTAAAGALVLLGVMGNVVLLNFCYDVPVKLYSTQLWLESLFVAWPALPALFAALVGGGPFARRRDPPLFASARARRIAAALHVALAAWLVGGPLHEEWSRHLRREPPPAMRAIRNAFEVDEMVVDGRAIPPGERSPLRWKRVSFGRRGMRVVRGDRRVEVYRTTEETTSPVKLDVRLLGEEDGASRGVLQLVPDPTGFVLEGTFEGRRVRAHLTLIDTSDSPLMTRGFHWINEVPFNR